MLKHLHIENIILIEEADIPFEDGLNVITGETGAGKSALIHALALVLGERANISAIRHGAEKGVVEATFSVDQNSEIIRLLQEAGIEVEKDEDLYIRREVSTLGKNRCFIQNRAASLALVKQVGNGLVNFVSQHANYLLKESAVHRAWVDQFGQLQKDVDLFSESWKRLQKIDQEIAHMRQEGAKRVREGETLQREIQEIAEADLQAGEEETLCEEHNRLAHAEELMQTIDGIIHGLDGEEGSAHAILRPLKGQFASISTMDSRLEGIAESYGRILLELQEIVYSLQTYLGKIESNPFRLQELNDRLAVISRMKKKYGVSIDEMIAYDRDAKERLTFLENLEESVVQREKEKKSLEQQCQILASTLTQKRKEAAKRLESAVTGELYSLHMDKSVFEIRVSLNSRCESGDDQVEMYLAPNVGEKSVPLKESASGGELSRVMLALQTVGVQKEKIESTRISQRFSGKDDVTNCSYMQRGCEKCGSIVFDEIDANIGGKTATAVGEKLQHISINQQVICITHFPQVAAQAHHHIHIRKEEKNGRTRTQVYVLDQEGRKEELVRMVGGQSALVNV